MALTSGPIETATSSTGVTRMSLGWGGDGTLGCREHPPVSPPMGQDEGWVKVGVQDGLQGLRFRVEVPDGDLGFRFRVRGHIWLGSMVGIWGWDHGWDPGLRFKVRGHIWDAGLRSRVGIWGWDHGWDPGLGPRSKGCIWDPELRSGFGIWGSMFGTQGLSSRSRRHGQDPGSRFKVSCHI